MSKASFPLNRRYLVLVAIFALGLYVILPQFTEFRSSWELLRQPDIGWTAAAGLLAASTYLAAAATYCLLAFRSLNYGRTIVVQLAAMFVNRIFPAGSGAIGMNYLYLKNNQHTNAQAGTVVAINNLLGLTGHFFLLGIVLLISGRTSQLSASALRLPETALIVVVLIAIGVMVALAVFRDPARKAWNDVRSQLATYRKRPLRLTAALISSMTLTLLNVLALYACAQALGIEASLALAMIILTAGVGGGAVSPTPGGLGGFEASMVAVMIAYGVGGASAVALALLYRLITYWLTLLAGAIAFIFTQKRAYI